MVISLSSLRGIKHTIRRIQKMMFSLICVWLFTCMSYGNIIAIWNITWNTRGTWVIFLMQYSVSEDPSEDPLLEQMTVDHNSSCGSGKRHEVKFSHDCTPCVFTPILYVCARPFHILRDRSISNVHYTSLHTRADYQL